MANDFVNQFSDFCIWKTCYPKRESAYAPGGIGVRQDNLLDFCLSGMYLLLLKFIIYVN